MAGRRKPKTFEEMVTELEEKIREEERGYYGERMVEEALKPKNVGELKNPDGAASITDSEGETMQIQLKVDGGIIKDIKFVTDARGPVIAFGSVVTELVKGKTVDEAATLGEGDIVSVLDGLPEEDPHTPELAVNTLKAALEDYKKKQED
ncbi:MAG TPA: iron-sulfur cluster assembly scaffold protein [Desulfobacteria bacterium]|nr:iron-sulfur cluster assembly scaffold protein [Desulfobacteria bacterium]